MTTNHNCEINDIIILYALCNTFLESQYDSNTDPVIIMETIVNWRIHTCLYIYIGSYIYSDESRDLVSVSDSASHCRVSDA